MFGIDVHLELQKKQEFHYRNMESDSDEQKKRAQNIESAIIELQIQIKESEAKISQRFNQFMHSVTQPDIYTQPSRKTLAQKEEELRRECSYLI